MANKVAQGQTFKIAAADWNSCLDAAEDYKRRKALGNEQGPRGGDPIQPSIIKVRNDTGDDLRRGDVVELGAFILSELELEVTNQSLWFEGLEPDLSHLSFAVAYDHIKEDEIGRACVAGVCYANVTINDAGHKYAHLASGSVVLSSAPTGPVKILHKPSGTGEKKCRVQLGGWTKRIWVGKADGAITKGSTGTISLWQWNGSAMADTTFNVTALAWGAAITSGKIVSAWQDERNYWLVAPWEC